MNGFLKRILHRCGSDMQEEGTWASDGAIPVTRVPTPLGNYTSAGVMYTFDSRDGKKLITCTVCGRFKWTNGRPAEVKRELVDGRVAR